MSYLLLMMTSVSAVNKTINETLKVGQEYTCDVSKYYNYSYTNYRRNWRVSSWLTIVSDGTHLKKIRADQYVSGTIQVVCDWYQLDAISNHEEPCRVEWNFTIEKIDVTSVSVQSPIYLDADRSVDITPSSQWMNVYPSDATVETVNWTSTDPSIATIGKSTGYLTGIKPGQTTIYCIVNGSVCSNEATVKVSEPSFTFKGFSVEDKANNVETKPTITATYSLALSQGDNFDKIALTDEQGKKVEGSVSLSGAALSFTPTKHLQPLSTYTLTIPKGAVKNKWGTAFSTAKSVSFTTTDWQHMTLSVMPEAKFITRGDQIVLTASVPEATIYYSTDGSEPATRYEKPVTFQGDMTLRAVAKLDGYYNTDELTHEYLQSMEIAEKYPGEAPLYNYADVNPSITYSYAIVKGSAFDDITLKKEGLEEVACDVLIQDKTLFVVPQEPLTTGTTYTLCLPEEAVRSLRGDGNKAFDWTFATGDYATAVSTGGPELMAALKTNGSLWTWGRWLTEANAEDGSYSYTTQSVPTEFSSSDVVAVSSGYMQHALIKRDGSLWMWGRQLCGEFGNGSTTASPQPVKVMEGVKHVSCGMQTTAVVKEDGTLWMCGRNDMGQIDDTRTVHTSYIKVADGVKEATLDWGSLHIVKTDGSTETRTWNETIDNDRQPITASIDDVAEVAYGWKSAIALRDDGSVWTWGTDSPLTEVINGRNPQSLEGISLLSGQLQMQVGERAVVVHRPKPLLADYSTLTWQSDNTAVAQVNNRGVLTAIADGKVVVTATISDEQGREYRDTCLVTVGDPSGIKERQMADWQLQVATGRQMLYVSGVPEGQTVNVYSASGICIYRGRMTGQKIAITTHQKGVYVVSAGQQVRKVMVK